MEKQKSSNHVSLNHYLLMIKKNPCVTSNAREKSFLTVNC